ncbi:MAG: AhpC/TSA family protein [Bacteroidaceae bacterium]|nr:AhpC/TSA family protein [Bacteroidaceae bacterium]MBR4527341.1 AhpC/TSA family protein [Bacteroidaceae bacterium]
MKTNKIFMFLAIMLFASCQHARFHVTGHITDATDTTLYLEHITLGDGIQTVDSVRLDKTGEFHLSGDTQKNPEFYRLRIGNQSINLAFDSTETVNVEASLKNMSFGYKVEGSGTCDTIRLLCLKLAELERAVRATAENRDFTLQERDTMIERLIHAYKTEVKLNFIQNHYDATSSYFACFQMLNGLLLFDPIRDKSDLTWLRAVANAWNEKYPGQPRSENLKNIAAEGRRNQAKPKEIVLDYDNEKVRELGIIDMTMPDINGKERTLSSLRGNVILLDFTAFALPGNQERTMRLRELYNKYHSQGFEIYQVSLDEDYHFWAQRSELLPWVCVFCEEGLQSDMVTLYRVDRVPTYFLIDRNCDLQARQEDIPNLGKAIEALL